MKHHDRFYPMQRRDFMKLCAAAIGSAAAARRAVAETYPGRAIHILVGFPPGSSPDITARLIGQSLAARLNQPIVIENRPGAATNIATEAVVRAAPDGYTLLWVTAANASNRLLVKTPSFDFARDIVPIARAVQVPNVMEVNPAVPAHTVGEFIAYAQANPGKLNFASLGTGTTSHLTGALFEMMAGIDMVHVPYRDSAQAIADLISGKTQVMFDTLPQSLPHIKAGELRPLAVTTAERAEALPQIPAMREFVQGYEASSWHGLGAPKNTPQEIVDQLNAGVNAGLSDPTLKARLASLGAIVSPSTPAEFEKFIAGETEKWTRVIDAVERHRS